jgi:hypothetical protein
LVATNSRSSPKQKSQAQLIIFSNSRPSPRIPTWFCYAPRISISLRHSRSCIRGCILAVQRWQATISPPLACRNSNPQVGSTLCCFLNGFLAAVCQFQCVANPLAIESFQAATLAFLAVSIVKDRLEGCEVWLYASAVRINSVGSFALQVSNLVSPLKVHPSSCVSTMTLDRRNDPKVHPRIRCGPNPTDTHWSSPALQHRGCQHLPCPRYQHFHDTTLC